MTASLFCDAVTKTHLHEPQQNHMYSCQQVQTRTEGREGRSYHLVAVSAPQYCQVSHYKMNIITLLTHVHRRSRAHPQRIPTRDIKSQIIHFKIVVSSLTNPQSRTISLRHVVTF
jgi:hypothetical protein